MNDVLVLVEHNNNEVDAFSLQQLKKGRQLADHLGVGLGAIVIGAALNPLVDTISGKGVDTIYALDNPEITKYNPEIFSRAILDIIKDVTPHLLLMSYTILGMEIAPMISVMAGIRLVSNCLDVQIGPEGQPIVARPMNGEKFYAKMKVSFPLIVSLRKGTLSGSELSARDTKRVDVSSNLDFASIRTKVLEVIQPALGDVDLTKAKLIVGVGRGIKKQANIDLARKLADSLGGVIAGSRPVIDMGWLAPAYQVGLSGMTVSPQVYIACGISGAAQHTAGMSDSEIIIAINEDPNAPIFRIANYGIVGDLFKILPVLIEHAERAEIQA